MKKNKKPRNNKPNKTAAKRTGSKSFTLAVSLLALAGALCVPFGMMIEGLK